MNGKFSDIKQKEQETKERDRVRREKLASYFFDLSKLTFGGMVVGIIIPLFTSTSDMRLWVAISSGILLTILSALLANKILR